jgi:hypothetical protein
MILKKERHLQVSSLLHLLIDREFTKFLIQTYGKEFLSTGSGVFDVAGGKGFLSFELHCINRIRCTLIEPRGPLQLHRRKRKVIRKILLKEVDDNDNKLSPDFKHIQECFTQDLWDRNESDIRDASIIIGMNPDEATEDIVLLSLEMRKPFAVVPCCVFTKLYPDRRLNGKLVTTYKVLILLCSKHVGND